MIYDSLTWCLGQNKIEILKKKSWCLGEKYVRSEISGQEVGK